MKTPSELGIKKGTVIAPKYGWKPSTYYVVEVAFSLTNVIHKVLFYSGFICKDGKPKGYNGLLSTKYESEKTIDDTFYLKALEKLNINLEYDKPIKVNEAALVANELADELSKCLDFKPWHVKWVTRRSDGVVRARKPSGRCIYEGTALNAACRALNSKFCGE